MGKTQVGRSRRTSSSSDHSCQESSTREPSPAILMWEFDAIMRAGRWQVAAALQSQNSDFGNTATQVED